MVVLEQGSSGMSDGDYSEQHGLAADSQVLFPSFRSKTVPRHGARRL